MSEEPELRHYARRAIDGAMEVVDREFDFVRCILPYNYAYTSNSQSAHEAEIICRALEYPMSAQGIQKVTIDLDGIARVDGKQAPKE